MAKISLYLFYNFCLHKENFAETHASDLIDGQHKRVQVSFPDPTLNFTMERPSTLLIIQTFHLHTTCT